MALPATAPGKAGLIAAIDGYRARLHLFDGATGRQLASRDLELPAGGRWHLAGTDGPARAIYLLIESDTRHAVAAARIRATVTAAGDDDLVVPLPGLREPSGVIYNTRRDEVYIPYDNSSTLHVVDYTAGGQIAEIALPTFGNDATALSPEGDHLYVASWPYGEIEIVDLTSRRFVRRIRNLGILPHMFSMTRLAAGGALYFPVGATAVNGCFGAGVTRLDPHTGEARTIRLGFAPVDLVEAGERFLVFGNEDRMAEVHRDGEIAVHPLPHRFPPRAEMAPHGTVYLAYGPHQSYWPAVYIWGARNGVLAIDPDDLSLYDRRLPRQPLDWAFDGRGRLWMAQNPWSRENAFLVCLVDGVREVDMGQRLELDDEVDRETTQRLLEYDGAADRLYLVRTGEEDGDPSVLHQLDPGTGESLRRVEVGPLATDLAFDGQSIYVTSFSTDTVAVIDKTNGSVSNLRVEDQPLRLARLGDDIYALPHRGSRVHQITGPGQSWQLPMAGLASGWRADNLLVWRDRLVVIGYAPDGLTALSLDPATGVSEVLLSEAYPYGDTRLDTYNSAFYMTGQYGDAVYALTRARIAANGELWLTDFLAGRVYVLSDL